MVRCDVEEKVSTAAKSTPHCEAPPPTTYAGSDRVSDGKASLMWGYGFYIDSTCQKGIEWMEDAIYKAQYDQCLNLKVGSTIYSMHIKDCSEDAIVGDILVQHIGIDCKVPGASRQEVAKQGVCHELDGSWRMLKCAKDLSSSTAKHITTAGLLIPMVLTASASVLINC